MSGVLFRFCGTMVAVPIAAWLLPGVHAANGEAAWIVGVLLAFIFLILRPITKLLLSPFNCLTFGLVGVIIDALLVRMATGIVPSFTIDNFWWALATAFIVLIAREILGKMADVTKPAR